MKVHTLADVSVPFARCSSCGLELPQSAQVEEYRTAGSRWIVAQCPDCRLMTPFRLEAA